MKKIFIILTIVMALGFTINTQGIIIDKILAKINNEIITQSELEEQLDELREELLQNYKPEEVEKVLNKQRIEFLGKLIDARIMLQEAKKLNITANDDEVEKQTEENINKIKKQFPDETKFLETLQQKGYNPDTLKEKLQKNIKENMIVQRLIYREVYSKMEVTESEIKEYFLHIGEETHARHILLKLMPDADTEQEIKTKEKISNIYKELVSGGNFTELAKKYSEDARAEEGGDLGFFKRGDMIPEFEIVLEKLKVGEFSEPARTRYGYHIIYVEERKALSREEEVRARHILVKTKEEADEIKKQLASGTLFENLAKEKSLDASSKEKGGDLGFFKKNMMIENFGDVAFVLKPGETSDIVQTKFGFHIIQSIEKRYVQFENLHDDIKNSLMQSKMEAGYLNWLYNLRKRNVIEIIK